MPVVAPKRNVLRGRIRAQVQYQLTLGRRLVKAYNTNPELLIFAPGTGVGSTLAFDQCLAQMEVALTTKA
jgi:hypothetical protein